jgi:hypothetical protein
MRYRNFKFLNQNSNFLTLQTLEFKKKIRSESLESKTELEFRLQWGSQKSEPKIGIPNLGSNQNITEGQICKIVSKCKHQQSHYDFLYTGSKKNSFWVSLFLASQSMFLIRSKLSITAYLFLALYESTALQSRWFLKNIKNFLCK